MKTIQNGEEVPEVPGMEREQDQTMTGTFIDRSTKLDGFRQLSFEREYQNLILEHSVSMTGPMGGRKTDSGEAESSLNEKRVRFDRKDDVFVASFPDEVEGDDELLEGLEAEQPWELFLGEGDLDIGDQWELEPSVVWRALNFGGDLSFEGENGSGPPNIDMDEIEFDGTVTATLDSVEEVEGASMAQISLAIEFTAVQDLTELVVSQQAEQDAHEGMMMPDIGSMINESTYSGVATLNWNMGSGAMSSFEMEYELEETQLVELSFEMGPETMEIDQTMVFEGEGSLTVNQEIENE